MNKKIKLIFLDLDNTLLKDDKSISAFNKEAIRKLKEKGVMVSLASGRPSLDLYGYIEELGLEESYHISDNGATIFKYNENAILVKKIDNDYYQYVASNLCKQNIAFGSFVVGRFIFHQGDTLYKAIQKYFVTTKIEMGDYANIKDSYKISTYYENDEQFKFINSLCKKGYLQGCIADLNLLDLMPYGVTKFLGVQKISEKLNIPISEICAIGDQDNDFAMVKGVGVGVAMANAINELKEVANVALDKTNEEDGVGHFITDNLL